MGAPAYIGADGVLRHPDGQPVTAPEGGGTVLLTSDVLAGGLAATVTA